MLLCNLPEDILAIVLRSCPLASHDATRSLKRNLPLLAVCRSWRRLAIPLVYNRAFVQYGNQPASRNDQSTRDASLEEPTDVAVKTNLGLIAMNGCARAVKRIKIDVHCVENPFPGWREVIQRMRRVASKWRAAELKIAMQLHSERHGNRAVDLTKYIDDIAEVGDALAALMPDVRRLVCGGEYINQYSWSACRRLARPLYGRLAGHYTDQLQMIGSIHPITVPLDCQFTRLKEMSVAVSSDADHQLPRIASEVLVDMSIVNGTSDHSWASFSADSDSRVIEFTKLKRLSATYNTISQEGGAVVRHRDGHPWKLRFPSLKRLSIGCSQDACPLLEYAVLPPRMEWVCIEMKSAAFQGTADLVLPETEFFFIVVSQHSRGDPSGLTAVNRILENVRGSKVLGLNFDDSSLPVLPESITCTALTYLTVSAPTSVDTVLALFARLPRLTQMSLCDLDLSDIQADISLPGAGEDAVVEPLSQSLEHLTINCNMWRHSPDMGVAVAVAKYMLLRIPTLVLLWALDTPKGPVLSFVEEYAPRYPHLRGVKLNLGEGWDSASSKLEFLLRD